MHSQRPCYYVPCSISRVPLPAVIGLALRSLLYMRPYLVRRYLNVLLAVLCYACRYGIVLSILVYAGLSLFIIGGLYVYVVVCVVYAYNLTWGGLKNGKNRGEPKRVLSRFCCVVRKSHGHFSIAPLSLNCSGDFL